MIQILVVPTKHEIQVPLQWHVDLEAQSLDLTAMSGFLGINLTV